MHALLKILLSKNVVVPVKITRYGGYNTWEEYIEKTIEALRLYYRLEKRCRK